MSFPSTPRQPPLRLTVPGPTQDRLRTMADTDPGYPVAAFAFHYAADLPPAAQQALLVGLLSVWPRTQGARADVHSAMLAAHARREGASVEQIEEAWGLRPGSGRAVLGRGNAQLARRDRAWPGWEERVSVAGDEETWALYGRDAEVLPEPDDPAAEAATALLSPGRYSAEEQAANLERIKALTLAMGGVVQEIPPDA